MTDHDRFDRELAERLRASEDRAPGGFAPQLPAGTRRRRLATSIAVAATGVLAAGVLVGVLLQPPSPPLGDATPSSTPSEEATPSLPATSEPTPTLAPSATPIASSPPVAWERGTIEVPDGSGFGPYFSGLRWIQGIGWLAYGQGRSEAAGEGPPVIWFSADGLTWSRAVMPAGLGGYVVVDLEVGLLPGGPRLVTATTDFQNSRLLVSDDGQTWTVANAPGVAVINAVAYGEDGFVAVGTDLYWAGTEHIAGVVWRSADGISWQATTPAALDGAVPVTVEAIAGRGYVALGRLDGEAPPRTLGWTSPNGMAWEVHQVRPAQSDGGSLGLVSDSDGSLLVAAGLDPDAFAGLTADGVDWSFESLPVTYAEPSQIDISADRVVVVGFVFIADGQSYSYVWVRDRSNAGWRSVDWQSPTADASEYAVAVGAAVSPTQSLILFSSGRVLLTDGPLQ